MNATTKLLKLSSARTIVQFAVILGAWTWHLSSTWAQSSQVMVKTTMGCLVAVEAQLVEMQTKDPSSSATWNWSGNCVDGLGSGRGALVHSYKAGSGEYIYEIVTTTTGQMHQGRYYGFQKIQSQTLSNNSAMRSGPRPVVFGFRYFDRQVVFSGLGLIGSDALLEPSGSATPARGFDWQRENVSIYDSKLGNLALMKVHCGLDKQKFPECGFGEGEQKYEVFRFWQTPPGFIYTPGTSINYTYCPNPRDRNSCADLATQLAKPFVESIESFLVESLPKLQDIDGETRKAGAELAKRRAEEAAAKVKAAEQVAQAQAKAAAEFDAALDKAPVGELFAMADELKVKGGKENTLKARLVLRKLISRFPEHKLATLAAQMLGELQNTQQ